MDPLNKITTSACQTANEARNAFCTGDIHTCKIKLRELNSMLTISGEHTKKTKPKAEEPCDGI